MLQSYYYLRIYPILRGKNGCVGNKKESHTSQRRMTLHEGLFKPLYKHSNKITYVARLILCERGGFA